MTDTPFPLVLSMTDIANFQRCRKLFHFAAVQGLNPIKHAPAVEKGLAFHEIMAHHVKSATWPDTTSEMLEVAQAYAERYPVERHSGVSVYCERPFFVEMLPDMWVRFTGDKITVAPNGVTILDYKTFSKAPTLDPDLDFQAKTYLVLAEAKWPDRGMYEFEWHHVRSELGRFLKVKGDAVWTEWSADERYLVNSMILADGERNLFHGELIACLLDIQDAFENERWYRTALKGHSPYTCGNCFYRSLCTQDAANGGNLTPDDIDRLTEPAEGRYALDDVLAQRPVGRAETKPVGCSIKWRR